MEGSESLSRVFKKAKLPRGGTGESATCLHWLPPPAPDIPVDMQHCFVNDDAQWAAVVAGGVAWSF